MRIVLALVLVILTQPFSAFALNEASEAFDSLYGNKVRDVKKTSTKSDDLEMAAELVGVAKDVVDQKGLLVLVCENAYDLSHRTTKGYSLAIEAMKLMAEHIPAKRAEATRKLVALLAKQYNFARTTKEKQEVGERYLAELMSLAERAVAGKDHASALSQYAKARAVATRIKSKRLETIKKKQAAVQAKRVVYQKIDQLLAALKNNPKDSVAAKALIELYITQLDQPEKARKYTFIVKDEAFKANVLMTRKPIMDLVESEALAMAKWYDGYALKKKSPQRAVLLVRSKACFQQYLTLHQSKDLTRKFAELAVTRIDRELAKLPAVVETLEESTDVAESKEEGRENQVLNWMDLSEEMAQQIKEKKYTRDGAKAHYSEGLINLQGEGKGNAFVFANTRTQDVVVRATIKFMKGYAGVLGVRVSEAGSCQLHLLSPDTITIRKEGPGGGREVHNVHSKDKFGNGTEIQFAVIGDTIMVFINGKRVARVNKGELPDRGGIMVGTIRANVGFMNVSYAVPSESQAKAMLSAP